MCIRDRTSNGLSAEKITQSSVAKRAVSGTSTHFSVYQPAAEAVACAEAEVVVAADSLHALISVAVDPVAAEGRGAHTRPLRGTVLHESAELVAFKTLPRVLVGGSAQSSRTLAAPIPTELAR